MSKSNNNLGTIEVEATEVGSSDKRNNPEGNVSEVVVVKAKEDEITMVQEEIPISQIEDQLEQAVQTRDVDFTREVQNLVGNQIDSAKDYLDALKQDKVISDYKIVPIGMATTLEVYPGVVTLTIDSEKKIISVEIS